MRLNLFGLGFIYSIQNAALAYFTAPYLVHIGYQDTTVGIVFALANALTLVALAYFTFFVHRYGTHALFVASAFLISTAFTLLSFLSAPLVATLVLIGQMVLTTFLYSVFDIGLEHETPREAETGRTRTIFLTIVNIAFVLVPAIAGSIISSSGFSVFFFSLSLITATLVIYGFYAFPRVPYARTAPSLHEALDTLVTSPNIRRVFSAQFLLQFFYGFMIMYMPIMLITVYGFTLQEMSIIFSMGVVAFLIVEPPVGFISDTLLGEKEMMILGFVILVFSTAILPLFAGASLIAWGTIMFITRIGAACIEATTESYFFKHVTSRDSALVSIFRMLSPFAQLCFPLLATAFLSCAPITWLPVALACVIGCVALIELPGLKDTR